VPRSHRALLPLAALLLLALLTGCGGGSSSTTATDPAASGGSSSSAAAGSTSCDFTADGQKPAKDVTPPPATTDLTGDVKATIDTSVGAFDATLDATQAPCTVASFLSLAKQGFYDDTPCHRLTTQGIYVLQCGDPTGTGTGGPGYTIPDEVHGTEAYTPGTLAMANTGQPNSGGSQFFIVYQDSTANLQKTYTVFGHLDAASIKAVQKVAAKGSDNSNGPGDGAPKQPVTITKVTSGG
jgi:peptidyl-prolyl cis-trans isomerase B (cyclophilin B)